MKKVGIIMGSDSDLPIIKKATDMLKALEIPFEVHIYSAHRTPVEARDESGIEDLTLLSDRPVSLEILTVSGHEKRGKYVPCHLHLNLTYLFEADPAQSLQVNADENSGVAWLEMDKLGQFSSEDWFVERIYSKLVRRSRNL